MLDLLSAFVQPFFRHVVVHPQSVSSLTPGLANRYAEETSFSEPRLRQIVRCGANRKRPRSRKNNDNQEPRANDMIPDFGPLGPTPAELSGFDGWREEDDEYWRDFRERTLLYQATTTVKPEDFEGPAQPLDRDGNPVTYPAQVKYDPELKQWRPTTVEEEERLKLPNPVKDPFYTPLANEDDEVTSLTDIINATESQWAPIENPAPSTSPMSDASELRRKPLNWKPRDWKVVHLGTSSAIPTRTRNVSSTAFLANGVEPSMFLVDAGENTVRRLMQCDWCMTHGFRWIRAIFITHLHGDHIFGLPSLLTSIGRNAQHRRRAALENGDDGSDPVIRIYGPYGTRGFVRSSLFWTAPVGVRFSISELVPRDSDFRHVRGMSNFESDIYVEDQATGEFVKAPALDEQECPPPHPEEVRADDVSVGEDGTWHIWHHPENDISLEVVAAPLKHRLPCFGYVFREPAVMPNCHEEKHHSVLHVANGNGTASNGTDRNREINIDMEKARELGVYGSQFRVLRAGRSVKVSKSGLTVTPEDVAASSLHFETAPAEESMSKKDSIYTRKVTILGDTCDSKLISEAARGSDLLIHEATFTDIMRQKAKIAMHSTARMAGQFGKSIEAKKIALTHFSSRHEILLMEGKSEDDMEEDDNEEDDFASPNLLVSEARQGYGVGKVHIVAAYDFMEHEIPAKEDEIVGNSHAEVDVVRNATMHG